MSDRFPPDVILLAAGLGTRMRPLTDTMPKPLIKVAGKPLIERVMRNCMQEGLTRFVVNAHYRADQIAAFVDAAPMRVPDAELTLSREDDELLETGGGVKKALGIVTSDPVLAMNTDAFWQGEDRPIARMQERFARADADAVLLCVQPHRALGFRRSHDFCLNPKGEITNDQGAPVIFAGAALLSRALFNDTPESPFSLNLVFERAHQAGRLAGVLLDAPWYHVGDPEALDEASTRLKGE